MSKGTYIVRCAGNPWGPFLRGNGRVNTTTKSLRGILAQHLYADVLRDSQTQIFDCEDSNLECSGIAVVNILHANSAHRLLRPVPSARRSAIGKNKGLSERVRVGGTVEKHLCKTRSQRLQAKTRGRAI